MPLARAQVQAGTSPFHRRTAVLALLGLFALLMAWRSPELLLEPRFWGEEGTAYFQNAYHGGFLRGVMFIFPNAGYFSLGSNLAATLAATVVPLTHAPAVTTWIAFVGQLVPFAVILGGNSYLWRDARTRLLACFALLLAPTSDSAVWLTSMHLPIWCGLIAFCLLMERSEEASPRAAWLRAGGLLFCFLTGPHALFLFPVFLLKALGTRARADWLAVQVGLLAILLQLGVHLYSREFMDSRRLPARQLDLRAAGIDAFSFHVLAPVAGPEEALEVRDYLAAQSGTPAGLLAGLTVVAGLAGLLALGWRGSWRSVENLAVVALLAVSSPTILFAHEFRASGRYGVLPGFLLLAVLLRWVRFDEGWRSLRSLLCLLLLAVSMTIGAGAFRKGTDLSYRPGCPRWSLEVERWQQDPTHRARIWPYRKNGPSWAVRL